MAFNPDDYLAQKEAPQGDFNPDAYLASKEAPPEEKSLGGLASNAMSDAGSMIGGMAQAVRHPIDTIGNVATHLPEIGHSMAHSWGLDSADEGHRMQTLEDEAYQHPVSHLLDAASLVAPGLKAAGLAPEALEGANIAGKAGEVAGEAGDALGRRALGYTKGMLKNGGLEKANDATHYAVDNDILKTGSTPAEMKEAIEAAHDTEGQKIGNVLKDEDRTGSSFDQSQASQRLEALRPRAESGEILRGGKYDALNSEIDDALETIKAHGDGPMTFRRGNELKKTLREGTNYSPFKDTGVNDIRKGIGGSFKDELDEQLGDSMAKRGAGPEEMQKFTDSKKNYGHLQGLEKAIDNRVSSTSGNRAVGLTDFIAGGAGGLAHGPAGAIGAVLAKKAVEKFGLTGGAVLGRKISQILANPANAAKYGRVLDAGMYATPAAMATALHVIEQKEGDNQ